MFRHLFKALVAASLALTPVTRGMAAPMVSAVAASKDAAGTSILNPRSERFAPQALGLDMAPIESSQFITADPPSGESVIRDAVLAAASTAGAAVGGAVAGPPGAIAGAAVGSIAGAFCLWLFSK